MDLTYEEFQRFKTRFPWTAWPDEDYRVPLEVGGPDGRSTWVAYIDGDQMVAAHDWLRAMRGRPDLRMVEADAQPVEAPVPARKAA